MSANTDKCADKDKAVCDYNEFRRLRYFHGMLLDDKDFQAEQQYHAGKRRLLNRMLHGSGVVCGLDLKSRKDARWIEITSGLALDCSGNEIWVPKTQRVDLASLLPPKEKPKGKDCKEEEDEGDVKTYYIGIRYEEKPTNPVSVYLPSATCEERTCENSRYKEGFCIEIVDCCPEKYDPGLLRALCDCEKNIQPKDSTQLCHDCGEAPRDNQDSSAQQVNFETWCKCVSLADFCERSVPCPECCSCDEPCYVVLGQIKVKDCRIQSVCMNECRRYVLTGRMVQHMLLGIFAGSEEFFFANINNGQEEVPIPDVGEVVNNPIKGLCWALENLLIKGGRMERNPCLPDRGQQPPPPPPPPDVVLRDLQEQVKSLKDQQLTLNAQLIRLQSVQPRPGPGPGEAAPQDLQDTAPLEAPAETTEKTTPQKPPKK